MAELFILILFGHLFGDYMFQPLQMALKKSEKSQVGLKWCLIHCVIYTACVCVFLLTLNPIIWIMVFLSHWAIDRYSLGAPWLKMIKGRDMLEAHNSKNEYREIGISFACIVYAVVDNTMHLFLMAPIAVIYHTELISRINLVANFIASNMMMSSVIYLSLLMVISLIAIKKQIKPQ